MSIIEHSIPNIWLDKWNYNSNELQRIVVILWNKMNSRQLFSIVSLIFIKFLQFFYGPTPSISE